MGVPVIAFTLSVIRMGVPVIGFARYGSFSVLLCVLKKCAVVFLIVSGASPLSVVLVCSPFLLQLYSDAMFSEIPLHCVKGCQSERSED